MRAFYTLFAAVLLALGAGLFFLALPKKGQLTVFGRSNFLGELCAFFCVGDRIPDDCGVQVSGHD